MMTKTPETPAIRVLNDAFRRELLVEGRRFLSPGIVALPPDDKAAIIVKVRTYDGFAPGNDLFGEHDFGAFDHAGMRIVWKIDYYDPAMERASEDPADLTKTCRVLTIMLAKEW